jgi:hypothetical protein
MGLPYTICFCCHREQVLLLCRTFPPNTQLWNELGGKYDLFALLKRFHTDLHLNF